MVYFEKVQVHSIECRISSCKAQITGFDPLKILGGGDWVSYLQPLLQKHQSGLRARHTMEIILWSK
jgi:hypothetical protein